MAIDSSGGRDSVSPNEKGAAGCASSAGHGAGVAAVSPGNDRVTVNEGDEPRSVDELPVNAPEYAATELQACCDRTAAEHALLAVQEQLSRIEDQVRGATSMPY